MEDKYFINITINEENLSDGSIIFVAYCPRLEIASQGKTIDEALANIKEAVELYLEEQPEKYQELQGEKTAFFSVIEVNKNGKTASIIR